MLSLDRTKIELRSLEIQSAWSELHDRAHDVLRGAEHSSPEEAWLNYLIGKALVGLGRSEAALHWLQRSLRLQPAQSHAQYLMGFALAAHGEWLAALAAQQCACGLDPSYADAWYEQGRAALELGDDPRAVASLRRALLLKPDWEAASALFHAAEVREALRLGVEPASVLICGVLKESSPPMWLLHEWVELAGVYLLADQPQPASSLLQALAERPKGVEGCSQPFPRRFALFLQVLLDQLHPPGEPWYGSLAQELRACLWLPPCTAEQAFWPSLVEPLLQRWLARAPQRFSEEEAEAARLLLDALPALEPAGLDSERLYRDLADRLPQREAEGFLAFAPRLKRSGSDLASLAWLPDLLAAATERLRQKPTDAGVRRLLDQHLLALSGAMLELPNRLVALPGAETQALALRQEAVCRLVQAGPAVIGLDGQAMAPSRSRPRRRWLLLATDDLPQCLLYRVEQKRGQLERLGCEVRLVLREELDGWAYSTDLLWADAVLVCRLAATHPVLRAMALARRFGLPVLYDIDDLLFDPEHCPPAFNTYGGSLRPALHRRFALDVPLFEQVMRQADGVIVSTATLAARWRALHPNSTQPVWILPNLAPPDLIELAAAPPALEQRAGRPLRLVVASGTTAHKQAWQEELAPALADLLAANARLELDLLGHLQLPPPLLPFVERVHCRPYSAYGSYLRQLQRADIGLVVLEPGTFTDAKSAIRWMEFSLLGLASVLSPTATYRELLEEGRHALFARGRAEWVQAIQRLIDDPQRRHQLAAQAYEHARAQFAPEQADGFWQPLLAPSAAPQPRRTRLLVLNVFFAPQSVGGATRVAQDQVRALLERAGDRYEVTVLCADQAGWQQPEDPDDDAEPVLAVDGHGWHGARVVRLSLPARSWRDHTDLAVAAFCRQWFSSEGFDLIHAHCVQLLTAAPLQVAAELGIPYLITVHDGWWLSPRLFLTTASGHPIDPADPLAHYDQPDAQPQDLLQADLERRQALAQVLAAAKARLAVSAAFAEVLRRGGVADVQVLENDWQPMASRRRAARRASEPLRFCYVGGLALHKGYAVLQAALLRHGLADAGAGAQLTVIDASLQPGEGFSLIWNGTAVQFIPSVPMAEMAAFYAEQDVLIAPSIWPESYGLVTREALSAGLWVVASDIGALADPIEHGRNGHRLPPGDADALGAVLLELCRQHPTPQPLLQFSGRAAAIDQLLPLYDRLAS